MLQHIHFRCYDGKKDSNRAKQPKTFYRADCSTKLLYGQNILHYNEVAISERFKKGLLPQGNTMGLGDLLCRKRYLRNYKAAVDKLNDLFGKEGHSTHEYVCVGIYLMQNKDASGFSPKAMLGITEKIQQLIDHFDSHVAVTKMIAEAIFKKRAVAEEAEKELTEIIEDRGDMDSLAYFQHVGVRLEGFRYAGESKRISSNLLSPDDNV